MSNKFANGLVDTMNVSITENGAKGFSTSKSKLIDINFAVPSLRGMSPSDIGLKFISAYCEDADLAIRWLFYLGDVREGLGERYAFKSIVSYLIANRPEIAKKILSLIPEYSRWDNVFVYMDTALENDMVKLVASQLADDILALKDKKPVSLLAKWMPSVNTSSKAAVALAYKFIDKLNKIVPTAGNAWTPRSYRKTLAALRKHLDVVEVKTSSNKWAEINYESVPSKANLKYRNAFLRNDEIRRHVFLDNVATGKAKINASVLYPHDIVAKYRGTEYNVYCRKIAAKDDSLEALWKALPNTITGAESESVLVVQDGSGSMQCGIPNSNVQALDVSIGLSIYTAERLSGPFHNMIMAFGSNPELMQLSDNMTLQEKISTVLKNDDCGSTNIAAVFDKILQTAISTNCSQEDMPKNILIVSDMEFDSGCYFSESSDNYGVYWRHHPENDPTLFSKIEDKFTAAGYKLPKLIFWNVNSRTGTIPMIHNTLGVNLVSGYSTSNLKMVLSGECSPYLALKNLLMTKRYDPVSEALSK